MSRLNQLMKAERYTRNRHRLPTPKQTEYAITLGIDPANHTFLSLSSAIDEAKQSRFEHLKREYEELDRELQRSGDILALAEKVSKLKKNGRGWHGPCPECTIGKNQDRFIVNTDKNTFWCRQCGFKGGLAQLAAYVWKCSTWDAIDSLSGQSPRRESVRTRVSQVTRTERREEERPYRDFSSVCQTAINRLTHPVAGQAGREYLLNRGIAQDEYLIQRGVTEHVLTANRVGLMEDYKRGLVVCFPHEVMINGQWQIISLNRRFLDDEDRIAKIEAALERGEEKPNIPKTKHVKGGRWGLYRLATIPRAKVLIIVEGEINGLSLWLVCRVMGWPVDIVSVGAEGAFVKLAAHITELAKFYENVIIWADEAEKAKAASRAISHPAIKALRSPMLEGEELDANNLLMMDDLLSMGILTSYLEQILPESLLIPCEPSTEPLKTSTESTGISTEPPQDEDEALWARYAAEMEEEPDEVTDEDDALWAKYAAELEDEEITARDELLLLCRQLCDKMANKREAKSWYSICENHFHHGDATSLCECYEAIKEAVNNQTKPCFPALPPARPDYSDCPIIEEDDPYYRWVWAARSVKMGHSDYLAEAWSWARKITDEQTRREALREMTRLTGDEDKQLALL